MPSLVRGKGLLREGKKPTGKGGKDKKGLRGGLKGMGWGRGKRSPISLTVEKKKGRGGGLRREGQVKREKQ